jgi:hypothetical protein
VAVAALVPLSVAVSVTAVPAGTLMLAPLCPPPDSEVDTVVGCAVVVDAVTVSTSPPVPQVLDEDWLAESPE